MFHMLSGPILPALILGTAALLVPHRGLAQTIQEFPASTSPIDPNLIPLGIAAGPDGNLWFAHTGRKFIGRFAPSSPKKITAFPDPTSVGLFQPGPVYIVAGQDGNMWFTEPTENRLGKIRANSSGTITEVSLPGSLVIGGTGRITVAPDGSLWFTGAAGYLRRYEPTTGAVTSFPLPKFGQYEVRAHDVTTGPDGNLWFTDDGGRIGRITAQAPNAITVFPNSTNYREAFGITAGPDGNLWFTEPSLDAIGRITPGGANTITEFALPTPGSRPLFIAAGPDGGLWFTEYSADQIGRIDPNAPNTILEFPVPTIGSAPCDITSGPDGNMWFTETADRIGRVRLSGGRFERLYLIDPYWWLNNSPYAIAPLGDVFYVPAKLGFAALGVVASGITYAATLGDLEATTAVLRYAGGGDYLMTPSMIRRGSGPRFVGSDRASVPVRRAWPPGVVH
jgi:virginiamycin B lyase